MRLQADTRKAGTPLIYCGEGPGVPSTVDLEALEPEVAARRLERWRPFLKDRDVILFDHRGCGRSGRDLKWRPETVPPEIFFADAGGALSYLCEESVKARQRLVADGARLHGYQAIDAAKDIDALRRELELDRFMLLGYSYGAQQLMSYLRVGDAVPSAAVLAGTEGCGDAYKLPLQTDRYFEAQGLLGAYRRAADRIERDRPRLTLHHRRLDCPFELEVGRFGLALAICRRLYAEGTLSQLPALLASISRGESDQLEGWIKRQLPLALRIDGMPYLVDAASGASRERLEQIEREQQASAFGNSMNFPFPQIGAAWQPPDLGDEYRLDPFSPLPALFVSGDLDWNTPLNQARRVAASFPNSTLHVAPGAVHETLMQNSSTLMCMATFLRSQDAIGS